MNKISLAELAVKHGTDKEVVGGHRYAERYERHFESLRERRLTILEIGVGGYDDPRAGGNSLRMWKDYFPQSRIYGIDIYDKSCHDELRIKTFRGSQTDAEFLRRVVEEMGPPDIIIDDGSHHNAHVIASFKILFPLLGPDGIYVIEDLQTSYWEGNDWGGARDLAAPHTSMNFLKSLVDGLNHEEFTIGGYAPSYFDKQIVALHFYHNLAFIYKGANDEGSNVLGKRDSQSEFSTAVDHHRAGRLPQAEAGYRRILAREPAHIDALHGLGTVALQSGKPDEAVRLISHAVAQRPGSMAFHSNLGMAHQALGEFAAAEAAFRRAIELAPRVGGLYFNLANALKSQKRLSAAIDCYRQAIELEPNNATTHNNLGNCYRELGRLDEARQSLSRAIQLRPDYAEAFLNLGNVLSSVGQPREGEACCREALRLQPRLAAAYVNLGIALRAQERNEEAAEAYRQAAQVSPTLAEAHSNFGLALLELGRLTEAIASFRRAVEVAPTRAEAWTGLGGGLMTLRQYAEADACYQRAAELQPDDPTIMSSWLFWRLYRPDSDLRSIADRHAAWNSRYGGADVRDVGAAKSAGVRAAPPRRAPIVDRKLRIGFVCADFGPHPVAHFTIETLEALPALGFEIVCYSTHPRGGELNARIKACAALWREAQHMPNNELAAQIAADRIDVLIDLAGHSAGNRLGAFARRPAPVQATWIGNEGTTGLSAMDYLIADEQIVPREAEAFYSERIVRLPTSYVAWKPPGEAPPVAPSPAASGAPLTFGSFNNPAKYHAGVADLWSKILRQAPDSRLLLQYRHLTNLELQRSIVELFTAQGIAAERLEFGDWRPYSQLLDSYRRVDIALDPFPFGGGVTTCEALWMGVPVVTWPGETFASRHSCSYLHTVGLTELIAPTPEAYVDIALRLASDLPRLQALRGSLRGRVAASPLCDGRGCAERLAEAVRQMWSGEVD